MRTRANLLFAAIGILLLPFLISRSQDNAFRHSAPIAQVAFAGHSNVAGREGDECFPCGTEDCVCNPGEEPGSMPDGEHKPDDPDNPDQGDPNPGPLALLAVLALLIWRFGR